MRTLMPVSLAAVLVAWLVHPMWAQNAVVGEAQYHQLARDILRELVEIKTTESGVGSTPAVEAMARRLTGAGFPSSDVQVLGPSLRKQNLVVRYHGSGSRRPLLLIAHLDVVEADPADWSGGLDPFTLTERDGFLYGRGTQDDKHSAAILVTNFIRWRRQGWVPDRDLILALTADEEAYGDEVGVQWLVQHHRELIDAEYCINLDSGDFQSRGGKPYVVTIAAAEKKETMVQLEVHNPGGHGSVPRPDNAIYAIAAALRQLQLHPFPFTTNDVTRAEFAGLAKLATGQTASDLRTLSTLPLDERAAERLAADPYYNALLRTTCAPTVLNAGRWPSALPQRAQATLNCRIAPTEAPDDVLARIKGIIHDDSVSVRFDFIEREAQPPSPLREELFEVLGQIRDRRWPGATVLPGLETGGTDGRFLRARGIPAYGVSGVFIEEGGLRAHGSDERIRIVDLNDGVSFYDEFVKALAGRRSASGPR